MIVPVVKIGQGDYTLDWPPSPVRREPADVYHARRRECLTSHRLADFRRCPLLFHRKEQGLVAESDTSAYLVGRATHVLVLEGRERYEAEFAVGGPINEKTGRPYGSNTKAFAEWAQRHGKPVLTDAQAALVEQMAASVRGHDAASGMLADGVAEGVVRCEYAGHACQARIDWLHPERGIVDLKTCDRIEGFERQVREFGYVHQMSFYRALLRTAGVGDLGAHLIAVEKTEPYRCGVWEIDRGLLDAAQQDNERAMAELALCRRTGYWPTRYEHIRRIA